jgi:hypothetical protein
MMSHHPAVGPKPTQLAPPETEDLKRAVHAQKPTNVAEQFNMEDGAKISSTAM